MWRRRDHTTNISWSIRLVTILLEGEGRLLRLVTRTSDSEGGAGSFLCLLVMSPWQSHLTLNFQPLTPIVTPDEYVDCTLVDPYNCQTDSWAQS